MSKDFIADMTAIVGPNAVLNAADDMAPFLSDWHSRYHGAAKAVILPETTNQVSAIMAYADAHDIVVVPQGGNTGFMGGATPDEDGNTIVISGAPRSGTSWLA